MKQIEELVDKYLDETAPINVEALRNQYEVLRNRVADEHDPAKKAVLTAQKAQLGKRISKLIDMYHKREKANAAKAAATKE